MINIIENEKYIDVVKRNYDITLKYYPNFDYSFDEFSNAFMYCFEDYEHFEDIRLDINSTKNYDWYRDTELSYMLNEALFEQLCELCLKGYEKLESEFELDYPFYEFDYDYRDCAGSLHEVVIPFECTYEELKNWVILDCFPCIKKDEEEKAYRENEI